MVILQCDRFKIRQINEADFEAMFEVYSNMSLMTFVGDGSAISESDCRKWIQITLDNYSNRGYGMFLVESPESQECLGFVGLTHPGGIEIPEIKYVLKQIYWGRGLATQIVSSLCEHAKNAWDLKEICATIDPENIASCKVMEKCGFQQSESIVEPDGDVTLRWIRRAD